MDKRLIFVALALAGCASSKQIYLPSGEQGFAIKCGGNAVSWNSCYERAGKLCGARGYAIIDRQGETTSGVAASQYGLVGGDTIHRSLLVACK